MPTTIPSNLIFQSPTNNDTLLDLNTQPSLDLQFAASKTLDDRVSGQNLITFSRSTTGTYVDSNGLIQTAAVDAPRFDHDPVTGESLGLLIEESRTNLLLLSQNFTAVWSDNNNDTTVVSNAIISPDGTLNGSKIIKDSGSSKSNLISNDIGITTGRAMFSIYAKAGGFDGIQLTSWADPNDFQNFDLVNGTLGNAGSVTPLVNSKITYVGNQWYRCSAYLKPSGTGKLGFQPVANPQTDGWYASNTGNGVDGIYVWGAQVEVGSFPTSYIPTSGSAVTRAADVAEITGTNFSSWYNQSEGSWFVETKSDDGVNGVFSVGSSTANVGGLNYDFNNFNAQWQGTVMNGTFNPVDGQFHKFAFTATKTSNTLAADGTQADTGTSTNSYAATELGVGVRDAYGGGFGNVYLNGHISRLTYYPYRLPNATLQEITS